MVGKGWIALDIDGTLTQDKYQIPSNVRNFLRDLWQKGWRMAMVTGRPFAFASQALSEIDFLYVFLPQNGSVVLEMPSQKLLFKHYLTAEVIPFIEKAYEGLDLDFLVYAGYEKGDFCYFRPKRLSKEALDYLEDLQKRQKEKWREVERFEVDAFPLIKGFGTREQMERVADRLQSCSLFQLSLIRDPFDEKMTLLLITDRCASKGLSLQELFRLQGRGEKVIAAGDDENDISLLEAADIKIAMPHAPPSLRKLADFIAPPVHEEGIISALQQALHACS